MITLTKTPRTIYLLVRQLNFLLFVGGFYEQVFNKSDNIRKMAADIKFHGVHGYT